MLRFLHEVVLGQTVTQKLETLFRRIHDLEKLQILRRNRSRIHHSLEVDQPVPVFAAVDNDENLLCQLLRLRKRKNFEKLVQGAEAARENHQCFGQVGEPELAHEEVVKLEIQRGSDVGIGHLLERQSDIQSHRLRSGLLCPEIGRFHDARTATSRDYEAAPASGNLNGPLAQKKSQLARVLVITRHVHSRERPFSTRFELAARKL